MDSQYFVYVNGAQDGPFTMDDIRERWHNAPDVFDTIMVWREGMDSWCLLSSLPKTDKVGVPAPATNNRIAAAGPLMRWFSHWSITVGVSIIIVLTIGALLSVNHGRGFTNSLGMKFEPGATPKQENPRLPDPQSPQLPTREPRLDLDVSKKAARITDSGAPRAQLATTDVETLRKLVDETITTVSIMRGMTGSNRVSKLVSEMEAFTGMHMSIGSMSRIRTTVIHFQYELAGTGVSKAEAYHLALRASGAVPKARGLGIFNENAELPNIGNFRVGSWEDILERRLQYLEDGFQRRGFQFNKNIEGDRALGKDLIQQAFPNSR